MTTREILLEFPKLRVLIVGDVCLDRWCRYAPDLALASAETGLPRIAVVRTEVTPGAAGTVANNLVALGAGHVAILGALGSDGNGYELRRALKNNQIDGELLVEHPDIATFTYTKLINEKNNVEDLPRVDIINRDNLPFAVEQEVADRLREHGSAYDVIMVSDQAETPKGGVVTSPVRDALAQLAADHPEKIIWADSRRRAPEFRSVILKINEAEADAACRALPWAGANYEGLRHHTGAPLLLVTQGPGGVILIDANGSQTVAAKPIEYPTDICGAGDSFSAGAALAYAITHSATEAARIGNFVASITIMKPGTGTASPEEVLASEDRA